MEKLTKLTKLSSLVLSATLVMTGCQSTGNEAVDAVANVNSGFLSDYAALSEKETDDDSELRSYISKEADFTQYKNVIIEPLTFYPEMPMLTQASGSVLDKVKDYMGDKISEDLKGHFKVVDVAGKDTLRIKTAISAITIDDKELSAYQYIPIAFVATAVSGGMNDMSVKMQTEMEITDSVTGEVVAAAVKRGEGEKLDNKDTMLELSHLTPLIDDWTETFKNNIANRLKK